MRLDLKLCAFPLPDRLAVQPFLSQLALMNDEGDKIVSPGHGTICSQVWVFYFHQHRILNTQCPSDFTSHVM